MDTSNYVRLAIALGLGLMSATVLPRILTDGQGTAHATIPTSHQVVMIQKTAQNGTVYGPVVSETFADPRRIMPPLIFRRL